MKVIIDSNIDRSNGTLQYYSDVSAKSEEKLKKIFDDNLDVDTIVAICDTTTFRSYKSGIIFMISGIYYLGKRKKVFYINYQEIERIDISPDNENSIYSLNARMKIILTSGAHITIEAGDFYKDNLRGLLYKLKEEYIKDNDFFCVRPSGEVCNVRLTVEQKMLCEKIIHSAATAAGGVGAVGAQVPIADNLIITPVQIGMIVSLGKVFDIDVTDSVAKGIIAGFVGAFVGRNATQILVGWMPVVGNAINTATAFGITEIIGWGAVEHFLRTIDAQREKHKLHGIKEGVERASKEYEEKLRNQASEFIKQKEILLNQFDEYEKLVGEYEKYIEKLELERTNQEVDDENLDSNITELRTELMDLVKMRVG